jgi:hypothetical protein
MPCKVQIRIQKHFDRLLKYGILWPFQSSWNTPLLPVQKPGAEDFRPVQDQWAVNSATVTLYFIIPNPYMLLGLVPAEAKFFTCLDLPPLEPFHKPTCLDLKDAFFCICLAPQSQPIFAFQWEKSQHWGEETANLDLVATRFQKIAHYFWNFLSIQPESLSRPAQLHMPLLYR